jgi:hypothetical protein
MDNESGTPETHKFVRDPGLPKTSDPLAGLQKNQIFTGPVGLLAIPAAQSHLSFKLVEEDFQNLDSPQMK